MAWIDMIPEAKATGRLENAWMHFSVFHPGPFQGFGGLVHRCYQAQGFYRLTQQPRVATILVFYQFGGEVLVFLRQVFFPQVGGLDYVLVAVNSFVLHRVFPA